MALAITQIKTKEMRKISRRFEKGLPRVLENKPEIFKRRARRLNKAGELSDDIFIRRLKDVLDLNKEWRKIGEDAGVFKANNDDGTEIVCLGACLFVAGLAVGIAIGVAIDD